MIGFCEGQVNQPYGIDYLDEDNDVFVSDSGSHCVYKFKLPKFQLVTNGREERNWYKRVQCILATSP